MSHSAIAAKNAVAPKSGKWVGLIKANGEVVGGANLKVTPDGRIRGAGFSNDTITGVHGRVSAEGGITLIEYGKYERHFRGRLREAGSWTVRNKVLSFSASKVPGNSPGGSYYGHCTIAAYRGRTLVQTGKELAVIVHPDGRATALLHDGTKFRRLEGRIQDGKLICTGFVKLRNSGIPDRLHIKLIGKIKGSKIVDDIDSSRDKEFHYPRFEIYKWYVN